MNFFEAQDRARRNTVKLVILYLFAVIGIVVSVYVVVLLAFGAQGEVPAHLSWWQQVWHPDLFLIVSGVILAVIMIGTLFRMSQLRKGGSAVAEMLGGRKIEPSTRDRQERQLMNVVEEMSIASGIPVPDVYVLDREENINAFAAGFGTDDAAIGVTKGTLDKLNRDELQGVIAHEYSHIFNGDMRLNIRLIGILNGILLLHVMGMILMRSTLFSGMRAGGGGRGGGKGGGGAIIAILVIGIALLIIGYIGMLFGRMIQAAISRQREYLADAAAVQYTRNPEGLSSALRKIQRTAEGGKIKDGHAMEMSHLFFASSFGKMFATHPPIEDRINAIDPAHDEINEKKKEKIRQRLEKDHVAKPKAKAEGEKSTVMGDHAALTPEVILGAIGTIEQQQVQQAGQLLSKIPAVLRQAAHEPLDAEALVYAMLLAGQKTGEVSEWLKDATDPELTDRIDFLRRQLRRGRREWYLPLAELSVPALRQMSENQYRDFRKNIVRLARQDEKVSLFEFALEKMIIRQLDTAFSEKKSTKVRHRDLSALHNEVALLISALSHAADKDSEKAFEAGVAPLNEVLSTKPQLLSEEQCTFEKLDKALDEFNAASNSVKKYVLTAAVHCIMSDGTISLEERELLRAVSEAMDCPMPMGG